MTTVEKVNSIISCEKVQNTFYNLFDRWRDEHEHEGLGEYGKCIIGVITKNFPTYGVSLNKTTSEPFGIKFNIDDSCFHLYVNIRGEYLVMSCKKV
jgi:hypothetical protein